MSKTIYFLTILLLMHINVLIAGITKEEIIYGSGTIQIRLKVHVQDEKDLTDNDINLLRDFTTGDDQMKIIYCTHTNCGFTVRKLKEIAPCFFTEVREYNNKPWILNKKSAKNLAKLDNGKSCGSQIILTIEPHKGDIRVVFVKDNKINAGNIAGGQEDCDITEDENETFLNTAKRELSEEIELKNIDDQKLKKIGILSSIAKSTFLENTTWQKISVIYTYHLDVSETQKWFSKINAHKILSAPVHSHKVSNNDEIEWIFFAKPEIFLNKKLEFPLENNNTVKIVDHNVDIAAFVLRAIFNQEVLIGRNIDYVDGIIEYNGHQIEFKNTQKQ